MTVPFSVWLSDFLFHTSEGEYHLQHSLVLQYSSSSIKGTSTALQLRMQVHTGTKCSLSASENICCLGGELLPMVTAVWTHPSCSAWWREFCLLQASGCRIWPRPSPPGTPETHKNQWCTNCCRPSVKKAPALEHRVDFRSWMCFCLSSNQRPYQPRLPKRNNQAVTACSPVSLSYFVFQIVVTFT